jgi:competence protein ComEA
VPDDPSSPIEPFRPLPDLSWRERAERWMDQLRSLGRAPRTALAVVASVVVAVACLMLLRPGAADSAPDESLPRASAPAAPAPASAAPTTVPAVVVQAAGAVMRPGLYRLAPGARVDDLVQAAGGLATDADADRVNLAALLSDGEKVYVPRVGEPVPDGAVDAGASSATGPSSAASPVDLNSASIAQLDTLPGVGPATAQAIVDYRSAHGRFTSVDDLLNVRGIGPSKLEELRPLVRV